MDYGGRRPGAAQHQETNQMANRPRAKIAKLVGGILSTRYIVFLIFFKVPHDLLYQPRGRGG